MSEADQATSTEGKPSKETNWDQGESHPSLVKLLQSDKADELGISKPGRVLVPGCGLGYDLLVFAARGDLEAVGLDISPTGAERAKQYLKSQLGKKGYSYLSNRQTQIQIQDFFEYEVQEDQLYDVIYDYTFLCAIDPSLRPQWAEQMRKLSRPSPETRLITLMWPIIPGESNGDGPPFSLSPQKYHALLDAGWSLLWEEDVPGEMKRKKGRIIGPGEKIGVWKRNV